MRFFFLKLIAGVFFVTATNLSIGQTSLTLLKQYMILSPAKIDQILSKKGFSFESSRKNDGNDGKSYRWDRGTNTAAYQSFVWGWVNVDTVPVYVEGSREYKGYGDCAYRVMAYKSFNPGSFNSIFGLLSANSLYEKKDESDENGITTRFQNDKYSIVFSKSRASEVVHILYEIVVQERIAFAYRIHNIDGSITTLKGIDLGN